MEDSRRAHIAIVGWACTTLCLVSYVAAFSHGASLSACTDMMPRHLRAQLHSPNNYVTVHTNMSFYSPGDKVPVTVRSTRDFMGFLLQARKVSNNEITGTFIFIPPGSKLLTCFEDGDTVTHSDKSLKRNLSFVWKAPDQPVGDIKFFISVVQSYFVYWAKIESGVVAHRGQNEMPAGSSKRLDPVTAVTPLQGPADPTGPTSPVAATAFPLHTTVPPASPTGTAAALTPEPDFSAHPIAEPKQLARPSRAVSSGSSGSSSQWLEQSLLTRDPSTTAAIQELLPQDNASSYSTSSGAGSTASAATPRLCLMCKEDGQANTKSGNIMEASHIVTASPPAPHLHTHLGDAAVTTAWFNNADAASNLSSASRQMAERKQAPQPEEAGTRGKEEEEEEEEVEGNTLSWVTRPAPEFVIPGKGEDSGRGTRLLAAQLGVLLVCTAALGLALAAAVRCVCAQHCHKRTEVSFSEPDPGVITVSENGEVMHFRKIRENSFVLVQAEYNWVCPSSSGKKTII